MIIGILPAMYSVGRVDKIDSDIDIIISMINMTDLASIQRANSNGILKIQAMALK